MKILAIIPMLLISTSVLADPWMTHRDACEEFNERKEEFGFSCKVTDGFEQVFFDIKVVNPKMNKKQRRVISHFAQAVAFTTQGRTRGVVRIDNPQIDKLLVCALGRTTAGLDMICEHLSK